MRRIAPVIAIAVVVTSMLAACSSGGGSGVNWVSYGGKFQDDQVTAWQVPATASTGIKFVNTSPLDQAQLEAMVKANNVVWDVSTPDNDVAQRYCGELYQPLDSALVDPNAYKKGTVSSPCGAPSYVYANMFSYVAGAYKGKVPTSINDFFDVAKFPGQRVLYDLADTGILEAALVADGVAPDKLYPMDLNRAFAKLDTIKSHLTLAPTLGAVGQALSGGQATMTLLPTARMVTTALAGVDLQPVWDFTTYAAGVLAITKGSPNAAMAEKAIKAILTKESAVKYAQLTGTAPALASVTSADVKYDPVQARFDAFDPKYQRGTVIPKDETYWATHYSEIVDRWNKWKVG